MSELEALQQSLGHTFKNVGLLENALTHSSWSNENRDRSIPCNERLEFLGDAVLGFLVAGYLYNRFPNLPEGKMTRLRADLVCERALHTVSEALGLGKHLRLGRGELATGGRERASINADAVEAVIAALYLDGGLAAAESFVRKYILDVFEAGEAHPDRDAKSELQELIQRKSGQVLEYRHVSSQGPDHMKVFNVEVWLNGQLLAGGQGHSKKDAEQHAALKALEVLQ